MVQREMTRNLLKPQYEYSFAMNNYTKDFYEEEISNEYH
jgi:hypothetical protein